LHGKRGEEDVRFSQQKKYATDFNFIFGGLKRDTMTRRVRLLIERTGENATRLKVP
jgi:hypothetical protein